MDEDMTISAELNSSAKMNKKRKHQAEPLDTPLPKHVCWDKTPEYEFSSELPKKGRKSIFARRVESAPESVIHSFSFPGGTNSSMSTYIYTKTHAPVGHSTTIWDNKSSETGLYTIEESPPLTKESSKESDSAVISDYGLLLSDNYEDHLQEYGSHGDCSFFEDQFSGGDYSFSEDQFSGVEDSTNTDLEVLLNAHGAYANSQQKATKTIDKEFEEYFSMLML